MFQLLLVSFDFMIHSLLSVLGCSAVQRMDCCTLAMGGGMSRVCMCVWEGRTNECLYICASLHLIMDSFLVCLVTADVQSKPVNRGKRSSL